MNYLKVIDNEGKETVGGSQMWFEDPVFVNSGCGVVAALDNFLVATGTKSLDKDEYMDLLIKASQNVRPMRIPFIRKAIKVGSSTFLGSLGVSVIGFKSGIRRLSQGLDKKLKVVSYGTNKINKVLDTLKGGRSVIFLIRTPFSKIRLYKVDNPESFVDINYHWVTVVDFDQEALIVTSWGKRYKIMLKDISKFSVFARFVEVLTI